MPFLKKLVPRLFPIELETKYHQKKTQKPTNNCLIIGLFGATQKFFSTFLKSITFDILKAKLKKRYSDFAPQKPDINHVFIGIVY